MDLISNLTKNLFVDADNSVDRSTWSAEFQGNALLYLYGDDQVEALKECIIYDEVSRITMDAAIEALMPYDDSTWNKYFKAVQKMDEYNWLPCMKNEEIKELTDQNAKFSYLFFVLQEDIASVLAKNIAKN